MKKALITICLVLVVVASLIVLGCNRQISNKTSNKAEVSERAKKITQIYLNLEEMRDYIYFPGVRNYQLETEMNKKKISVSASVLYNSSYGISLICEVYDANYMHSPIDLRKNLKFLRLEANNKGAITVKITDSYKKEEIVSDSEALKNAAIIMDRTIEFILDSQNIQFFQELAQREKVNTEKEKAKQQKLIAAGLLVKDSNNSQAVEKK